MKDSSRPLWAPWRIDFICSEKKDGCFLCDQKIKSTSCEEAIIIARYEYVFVILNRFPYNSGHCMVAPYRHIGDISDLERAERHEIMDVTVTLKEVLQTVMKPEGFNVGFNLGLAAGAGVKDHIHLHVVPRWNGDTNFMPVLGNLRVVPEALENTAALLRENWPN